jgi:hypothetical protein
MVYLLYFIHTKKSMGHVGFEPTTNRLKADCSTVELMTQNAGVCHTRLSFIYGFFDIILP